MTKIPPYFISDGSDRIKKYKFELPQPFVYKPFTLEKKHNILIRPKTATPQPKYKFKPPPQRITFNPPVMTDLFSGIRQPKVYTSLNTPVVSGEEFIKRFGSFKK
jgi:hypothetical protein